MKRFLQICKGYVLWFPALIGLAYLVAFLVVSPSLKEIIFRPSNALITILAASLFWVWILGTTRIRIKNGKQIEDISLGEVASGTPSSFDYDDGRKKATHPHINEDLLADSPTQFDYLLGKLGKKYVGIPRKAKGASHVLISGGSGTGKSSSLIVPNLILEKYDGNTNHLAIDIKHELTDLTASEEDGTIIFDPLDRQSWGYDPFAGIGENPTDQHLYDEMYMIAISLVPMPSAKSHSDGPWNQLAVDMELGFLIYCYQYKGIHTLPEIHKYMLSRPMKELIDEALKTANPSGNAYMQLIRFKGMSDETLYSVTATLFPKISQLATDQALVYALSVNPRKWSMNDLLTHSVNICIPLDKIKQWGQLVFLLINQFSIWLFKLPEQAKEPNRPNIRLILDETTALFSALNSVPDQYPQLLRYGRSRGLQVITVIQSISGLLSIIEKDTVDDLLSNMPYKIFLDCTTTSTSEMLISQAGKFSCRHVSWSGAGSNKTQQISYSEEDILRGQDLLCIGGSDELILISSIAGYQRIKKCPYYMDSYFRNILTH